MIFLLRGQLSFFKSSRYYHFPAVPSPNGHSEVPQLGLLKAGHHAIKGLEGKHGLAIRQHQWLLLGCVKCHLSATLHFSLGQIIDISAVNLMFVKVVLLYVSVIVG